LPMPREMVRQGGRSARIQAAVHDTTRALLAEMDRAEITVPMIAERAGVTPSTIYRRWGDIGQVFADVAVERLRPIAEPDDTGSILGDLTAYILPYAEEMSSQIGRTMLRDVVADVADSRAAVKCCQYVQDALHIITARATRRGEAPLTVAELTDRLIAPINYHILFGDRDVSPQYCSSLLAALPAPQRVVVAA
jgi:AcrR family transcriptional regulator